MHTKSVKQIWKCLQIWYCWYYMPPCIGYFTIPPSYHASLRPCGQQESGVWRGISQPTQTKHLAWVCRHICLKACEVRGMELTPCSSHCFDHTYCLLNTLRPRQNGRHFPDAIFKWIFLNENVWISIEISLKFVPIGPINNIPALVQIMAWRRPGDKPLSEPMMVSLLTHMCITRCQWVKYFSWNCPQMNITGPQWW